jgi:hypothetical protein
MEAIVVLGADRVGKTTSINATKTFLESAGKSVSILHFSQVRPEHHSPIDQFVTALDGLKAEVLPDYLLIDRFVSDTLFYEHYRNNFEQIDFSWAKSVESRLNSMCDQISYVMINKGWDQQLIERHILEIKQETKYTATDYWIGINLEVRRNEHIAYNNHTSNYLETLKKSGVKVVKKSDQLNLLESLKA